MSRRYIAIISMLCACFLMIATNVMPHHHHDDGRICIVLGNDHDEDDAAAEEHEHEGCKGDCMMKLDAAQDVSQPGHGFKIGLLPAFVAVLWDLPRLLEPNESELFISFVYKELFWPSIVGESFGLRAPPYKA